MNPAALDASTANSATRPRNARAFTRFLPAIARVLLGFPLLVFGLNGFFNFIPPPEMTMPEKALNFSAALMESGYMMPMIGVTLLVSGALLLLNRFVPLALLFLAPFFVNSLCFHLFLERTGLPPAIVFSALVVYLAWVHRAAYRPLFQARAPRPSLHGDSIGPR